MNPEAKVQILLKNGSSIEFTVNDYNDAEQIAELINDGSDDIELCEVIDKEK